MNVALRRRRKPRTIVGKVIRAWPWIRLGLRVARFVRRAQRVIRIALVAAAAGAVAAIVRRLRRRREVPAQTYAPPPATAADWSGGTRETGYAAGPGTQTERHLGAVKSDDDGGKSPTFEAGAPDAPSPQESATTAPHGDPLAPGESTPGRDVPPPVEEEPPKKT